MRCEHEHDDAPPWTCSAVTFRGQNLLFLRMPDGSGLLAEQDQLDADHHVRFEAFFGDPFAHVRADGVIRRNGKNIGTISDLISRAA